MRLIDADEKKTRENDSLEMNDCELCYELGIIDKNNCKYCALVNPCIDCADYDVENDICTSEGACGDPDKKWKETSKQGRQRCRGDRRMTREEAIVHGKEQLDVFGGEHAEFIKLAIKALEKERWIPFTTRPLTEEEKEEHSEWDGILDCKLPDDGQRILVSISVRGHECVQYDEFYMDDGCYLDSGYEIGTEAVAWMPLPEPYKAEMKNENVCNGCYYNDGKVHAECVVCAKAEKMP